MLVTWESSRIYPFINAYVIAMLDMTVLVEVFSTNVHAHELTPA